MRGLRDLPTHSCFWILRGHRDSLNQRLQAAIQIAEGLRAAHRTIYTDHVGFEVRGVLHGDLKPSNVLVDFTGQNAVFRLPSFAAVSTLSGSKMTAVPGTEIELKVTTGAEDGDALCPMELVWARNSASASVRDKERNLCARRRTSQDRLRCDPMSFTLRPP
jgi:serine/threonine protein kinase